MTCVRPLSSAPELWPLLSPAPRCCRSRGARLRAQVRDDRRLRGSLAAGARQVLRPEDEGPRLGGDGQQAPLRLCRRQDGCAALRRHQRAARRARRLAHAPLHQGRDRLLRARRHLLLSAAPRYPQALRRRARCAMPASACSPRTSTARHSSRAVFPDMPAARAGLLAGDEIVAADNAPFAPIGSFRNKIGEKVDAAGAPRGERAPRRT